MKIAIITTGIFPVPAVKGGAVESLVDSLLAYNEHHKLHDITVFSVADPLVEHHPALQSDVNHYVFIDTTSMMAKFKKRLFKCLHPHTYYHYFIEYLPHEALRTIRRADFDCIVIENRPGFALQLRQSTRVPLVYHLHNDYLNDSTPRAELLYEAASRIITVSDYIGSRVRTCCADDQKTVTVHNGVDLSPFMSAASKNPAVTRESLGFAADDFVVVFCGRLIPEKGILELVEAMRLLADHPRIKLLVMGVSDSGDDVAPFVRELSAQMAQLGGRARMTGYVSHELIADYLHLCNVGVIPSMWDEPFGLSVIEAMAAGLPVIATSRGGIPEVVSDRNAILIDNPDRAFVPRLADAIRLLAADPALCAQMSATSLSMVQHFSKETYAEHFFAALEEIK